MMSRACDDTYWVPWLGLFRCIEKGLGTSATVSLLKIMWGWKAIIPNC